MIGGSNEVRVGDKNIWEGVDDKLDLLIVSNIMSTISNLWSYWTWQLDTALLNDYNVAYTHQTPKLTGKLLLWDSTILTFIISDLSRLYC